MRGALSCSKRLRGYIEGDEGDRIVLAQGLVSTPLQITLQPRLGTFYLGSLIGDFGPTEPPFWYEVGAKVDYYPNGSILFSLLKQLRSEPVVTTVPPGVRTVVAEMRHNTVQQPDPAQQPTPAGAEKGAAAPTREPAASRTPL